MFKLATRNILKSDQPLLKAKFRSLNPTKPVLLLCGSSYNPVENENWKIVKFLVAGKDNQNTSPTLESKPAKGSLSFPIIIAIVLGAIVISAISAVLIVRHIRRMGKEKKRPPATNGQAQRPQKALSQSPEFHELLLYEKQVPSPVVITAVLPKNEQSTKLIMDSGYTSHGSAGGSVKEVVVRQNTNGNIVWSVFASDTVIIWSSEIWHMYYMYT